VTRVRHPGRSIPGDEIVDRLRAAGHSVGRTRAAVVDAVRDQGSTFTAEELAAAVPGVHVATVYRTLALLEEIGALRHVHLSHGPAVYERISTADVRHVVCERCGRHLAVPGAVFASARRRLAAEFGFVLDGSHFAIVGRCADCASGPEGADAHHHG
jgi:Fur family transcriptional regulator, ferric uptake regulator